MPKVSLPPSQIREPGRLRGSERAPWRAGATERGRSARSDARARGASLDQPLDEALLPLCILNRARDVAHAPLEPRRLVRGAIRAPQPQSARYNQLQSVAIICNQLQSELLSRNPRGTISCNQLQSELLSRNPRGTKEEEFGRNQRGPPMRAFIRGALQ